MGFGNSEQNFGMIASKFTVAMWYTHRALPSINLKKKRKCSQSRKKAPCEEQVLSSEL